ncbi:MAG: hypothetical protein V3T31_02035 [candidate division Zixibacteria bacterium]
MNFLDKLSSMDRRWVYTLVWIAVIIPFIIPSEFPVGITPEAQQLYDAVEALPDSSTVMLTFDYYPSTLAETLPMSYAALHHLWRKDCKIVTMTTIPLGGPSMAEMVTRELALEYNKEYGKDFVNLGFKANWTAVLKGMGKSIEAIYPADNSGTPLSELPLMDSVKNYDDIDFIYVVADNGIVDYWISIVNAQFNARVGCAVTAVMAPKFYAFLGSGQMTGLLGGMKGAAEYEQLIGRKGEAFKGMAIQSLVHLLIIGLVLLGNIAHFFGRRSRRSAQ